MAVAYQSSQITAWGTRGTITITHPTSLAAGDLMTAIIVVTSTAQNTSSGWTLIQTLAANVQKMSIYQKIATSGDVSAGATSWTGGDAGEDKWGMISRFTGTDQTTPIAVYGTGSAYSATPSVTSTITPTKANSILVQYWMGRDTGTATINASGYAVANNNPSWTEIADAPIANIGGSGNYCAVGVAYGAYAPASATGNSSLTWTGTLDTVLLILAVEPPTPPTTSSFFQFF